ncbi:MAG: nucleotidyl transferase AbiEii/AbiGii toxin family protein [Myxococcota bacterium]
MKPGKNIAASVRARLLNIARENGEDYNRILLRYVQERLLYRLSQSAHARDFILKGAALFSLWDGQPHRPTKDTDFLGFGEPDPVKVRDVFRAIAAVPCPQDGLVFDPDGIEAAPIREQALYDGIRVTIPVSLGTFTTRTQVDIGFGDATVPEPVDAEFPTLLDLPAPRIRAYRPETAIAEKLEAIVSLGMTNSRVKDFYDLSVLLKRSDFDPHQLSQAVRATFARRGTALPSGRPLGLSHAFATDPRHLAQWRAFVGRLENDEAGELGEIVQQIWEAFRALPKFDEG